jgi:hypothetical protein
MTPLHWVLFACLVVLALGAITYKAPMRNKLPTFLTLVCMILCLIVGQPK